MENEQPQTPAKGSSFSAAGHQGRLASAGLSAELCFSGESFQGISNSRTRRGGWRKDHIWALSTWKHTSLTTTTCSHWCHHLVLSAKFVLELSSLSFIVSFLPAAGSSCLSACFRLSEINKTTTKPKQTENSKLFLKPTKVNCLWGLTEPRNVSNYQRAC